MGLEAFFRPRTVAVVGASADPAKLGHAILVNLVQGGFLRDDRRVFPINPRAGEILGLQAYPSVLAVPEAIDLAVVVIPYPAVPEAMRQIGEKRIPAAIVISAGFREAGPEGLQRERELLAVARRHGVRLVGPNCLGVVDTRTPLNASFSAGSPPAGPIAFMSQSGALGIAILDWARAGRLGLSKFVSLGNKADVDEVDLMDAWEADESSRVLAIYTEGLADGQAFLRAARRVARAKPIVALKSGVTQAGSRAVSSHTGSLAGSEQAYRAAFRQSGVVQATSLQELFDFASAFAYVRPPAGDRIAIITNAGGPGILATDALERAGLRLARFQPACLQALEAALPDAASAANPVDLLGDADAQRYRFALQQVTRDPGVDAVLVVLTPQALTDSAEVARVIVEAAAVSPVPILTCFLGQAGVQAGVEVLKQHNLANFPFPERAASALAAMDRYRRFHTAPRAEPQPLEADREAVAQLIEAAGREGRTALGEAEAEQVLRAYDIPTPPGELAASPEEAIQAAERLGYPVALKIASPDVLHKTDVGGVRLGLHSADDVRDAFELIVYRAQRYVPEARLRGCRVQRMAPPGLETLIGMSRDPQFGPLVTFGLGGIFVEALADVAFRLAPLSPAEAGEMLGEIRGSPLLEGTRGQPASDREALTQALLRVAQLAMDFPEIEEIDINPFVVYPEGKGGLALDLRVILQPRQPDSPPRSAK